MFGRTDVSSSPGYATRTQVYVLTVGKHGFAQPVSKDGWFEEYTKAAKRTRHGILLPSFNQAYLRSAACRREFGHIDHAKISIYVAQDNGRGK